MSKIDNTMEERTQRSTSEFFTKKNSLKKTQIMDENKSILTPIKEIEKTSRMLSSEEIISGKTIVKDEVPEPSPAPTINTVNTVDNIGSNVKEDVVPEPSPEPTINDVNSKFKDDVPEPSAEPINSVISNGSKQESVKSKKSKHGKNLRGSKSQELNKLDDEPTVQPTVQPTEPTESTEQIDSANSADSSDTPDSPDVPVPIPIPVNSTNTVKDGDIEPTVAPSQPTISYNIGDVPNVTEAPPAPGPSINTSFINQFGFNQVYKLGDYCPNNSTEPCDIVPTPSYSYDFVGFNQQNFGIQSQSQLIETSSSYDSYSNAHTNSSHFVAYMFVSMFALIVSIGIIIRYRKRFTYNRIPSIPRFEEYNDFA